jgi:oxygen-dependent protoporphyrinogen oxidase
MRVLIVGGGITGLAAAFEAAAAGADVTVVEAADHVGGKIRTEAVDGFLVEHGPDSFVSYRPAALALARELDMADEVIAANPGRSVFLRIDGQMVPLPEGMGMVLPTRLGPFVTTSILTWRQKLRAGLDLAMPRRLTARDTSAGAFLRTRLGDGVVDRIAEPLLGGIYGAGVDELSLDAVLPSLRTSEEQHRSLMLASLAQGRAARKSSGAGAPRGTSPFRSFRAGMGALVGRLEERLLKAGVVIRTGTSVVALEREPAGTTLAAFATRTPDGRTLPESASPTRFDAVIVATGAAAMADLLDDAVPAAAAALREIPQATSTVATLAWPESSFHTPPASQGWLEASAAPISGVTISSVKWFDRAPVGQVLLRAFVPARRGPLATASADEVVRVVSRHVAGVLGISGEPTLRRVTCWRQAMPTYTVGHPERVATVDSALRKVPGWHVAGSALHGVGVPECIADGRRVAVAALSA